MWTLLQFAMFIIFGGPLTYLTIQLLAWLMFLFTTPGAWRSMFPPPRQMQERREARTAQRALGSFALEYGLGEVYTVAERRSRADYQQSNDHSDCPICLSSFSGAPEDEAQPNDSDVEEGAQQPASRAPAIAADIASGWRRLVQRAESQPQSQSPDTDIAKLNVCGHAFHAQCLVTWFLNDKYQCPVCRAVYYTPSDAPQAPGQVYTRARGEFSRRILSRARWRARMRARARQRARVRERVEAQLEALVRPYALPAQLAVVDGQFEVLSETTPSGLALSGL